MSAPIRLISFEICPFVQRSAITLHEKGISFSAENIDLASKPDWFLKLSPTGKVPLLLIEDTVIFESAIINEYLDESYGSTTLHPSDALEKARHRSWIDWGTNGIGMAFAMGMAADEAALFEKRDALVKILSKIEEVLGEGPYFSGEKFSLVDAAMAPLLQRIEWTETMVPQLKVFETLPKVKQWWQELRVRPSIMASTVPHVEQLYREYLGGRGTATRRAEPSFAYRVFTGEAKLS